MPPRFYSEQRIEHENITISGDEVKHIVGAHRLGPGDNMIVFDGSGDEFLAKIEESQKRVVRAIITERRSISRESPIELKLAVALPKGDRQKVLVEKLVELGVTTLVPINAKRSVVISSEKSVEKLQRRVIEASKQCGRNRLMRILSPISAEALFAQECESHARYIAHPYQTDLPIHAAAAKVTKTVVVGIGPEGGFSENEVTQARDSGWQLVELTPTILRVETAAVAAAAFFAMSGKRG